MSIEHLQPGDFVKIRREGERFWLIVQSIEGESITAVVNNNLVFTDKHGLQVGDVVKFDRADVLDIIPAPVKH